MGGLFAAALDAQRSLTSIEAGCGSILIYQGLPNFGYNKTNLLKGFQCIAPAVDSEEALLMIGKTLGDYEAFIRSTSLWAELANLMNMPAEAI